MFNNLIEKKDLRVLIFSISFVFLVVLYSFFNNATRTEVVLAGSEHNLSGYAWSSNIGWISFNCTNTGTCGTSNYGVNIDTGTGNFSGFAWNDNIGWISFNPGDVSGCPSGSCAPNLNSSTGQVTGWARALSYGGGWDGWISLNCSNHSCASSNYGVTFSGANSAGYAWGDSVIGWMSWCGSSPNYCVIANAILGNQLPVAVISSPFVTDFTTVQSVPFNSIGSNDSDGTINAYDWRDGGCGSGTQLSTASAFDYTFTAQGTHPIYFRVQDDDGAWSACATITLNVTPPPAENGQCGAAASSVSGTQAAKINRAPSVNLCQAGIPTTPSSGNVDNKGPWSWNCNGQYGGTNSSCTAPRSCGDGICQPGKYETPVSCSLDCKADIQETL